MSEAPCGDGMVVIRLVFADGREVRGRVWGAEVGEIIDVDDWELGARLTFMVGAKVGPEVLLTEMGREGHCEGEDGQIPAGFVSLEEYMKLFPPVGHPIGKRARPKRQAKPQPSPAPADCSLCGGGGLVACEDGYRFCPECADGMAVVVGQWRTEEGQAQ